MTPVEMPAALAQRPQYKGMPVPANVYVDPDGVPDFAVIDAAVAQKLIRRGECAMCGKAMSPPYAFIGGENSINLGWFNDGPMHIECAEYASQVCPFVSGEKRSHRDGFKTHEGVDMAVLPFAAKADKENQPRMGILIVKSYKLTRVRARGTDVYVIETLGSIAVRWVDAK